MPKEIRLRYDEIKDAQTITQRNVRAFLEAGLDIHKNEVDAIDDDDRKQERIMKISTKKHFWMGS